MILKIDLHMFKMSLKPFTSYNCCQCTYKSIRSVSLTLKLKMTNQQLDLPTETSKTACCQKFSRLNLIAEAKSAQPKLKPTKQVLWNFS